MNFLPDTDDLQNDLLDHLCQKEKLTSDYQLARFLGLSLQAVRNYRKNKTHMDETTCVQIAQLLNLDPLQLIARIKFQRSQAPRVHHVWERYLGRVLLAFVAIALAATPGQMTFAQNGSTNADQFIHYPHYKLWFRAKLSRFLTWCQRKQDHPPLAFST